MLSKFSEALVLIWPSPVSMLNDPASAPVNRYSRVSPSSSVVLTGEPTFAPDALFSFTLRVAIMLLNDGSTLPDATWLEAALVADLPEPSGSV